MKHGYTIDKELQHNQHILLNNLLIHIESKVDVIDVQIGNNVFKHNDINKIHENGFIKI